MAARSLTALRQLKTELDGIEPYPWEHVEQWSERALPIVRQVCPDDLDDFRRVIKPPPPTGLPMALGSDRRENERRSAELRQIEESTDRRNCRQAHARIASFLSGIIAAHEAVEDSVEPEEQVVAPAPKSQQKPIFISHADSDKELVGKFVDELLLPGLDITTSEVFCTSLEGMKIPAGQDFIDFVKEQIQSPQVLLMLLTPNYFDRVFCCCEMGASWAMAHEGIPILVPPLDYDDLEAVLKTTQAVKIDQKRGLNEIKDRIVEKLELTIPSTERWEQKRDQFLAELPGVLKKLPPPQKVDRSQYEKLEKKYELQIQDLKESHETISELQATIEDLRTAKDKEEVDGIMRRHSTCWEEFEALKEELVERANDLPTIVVDLIFCEEASVDFQIPDQYHRHDRAFDRAIADKLITNPERTGVPESIRDDPTIENFCETVGKLRKFLERANPEDSSGDCHEFYEEYRTRYKHNPVFGNRRLWSEVLEIVD